MAQQHNRAAQFGEQAHSTYESLRQQAGETCEQTAEMVRRNPAGSALVIFGIGVGIGLVATAMLAPPRRRTVRSMLRNQEWLPREQFESIRDAVSDRVSRYLPEALSRYMD
jgi:hypothetical protein